MAPEFKGAKNYWKMGNFGKRWEEKKVTLRDSHSQAKK